MHKKFETNQTKINGGCQSVTHDSKSDLPLDTDAAALMYCHSGSDLIHEFHFKIT